MKKRKKHKWKYRVNVRKKILVLVILGVLLFVGIGFSIIEASLGLGGTLEVAKYDNDKTLYGVIKKEALNGGYAVKFDGEHQDSMDASKSTEDIYHFYADISVNGKNVLEKNNVIFADKCWQMFRTTDTGGVRLLYNGDPIITEVDGEKQYDCGTTRELYTISDAITTVSLSQTHYYAKNYTVSTSGDTTTFTLVDDPNDPDDYKSITVNSSNAATTIPDIAENYPYVCSSTNTTSCTNDKFYKVISHESGTDANAYQSAIRDTIGKSKYNDGDNSLAYLGYMYGDTYTYTNRGFSTNVGFTSTKTVLESRSLNTEFWYAHSIDYNTTVANRYSLNGEYQVSSTSDFPNLVGEYTFNQDTSGYDATWVRYIAYVNGSTMYYKELTGGNTNVYLNMSDDIEDNGDGTYSLKGPVTTVDIKNWYANHASYRNKYICEDFSTTCASPRYITSTTNTRYTYMSGDITIAKNRNGLTLQNYVTIKPHEWYSGYNTTYADYVYTCGNTDTVCTEANLRYIRSKGQTEYRYVPNNYFGKSVIYENNKYKLQDVEGLETYNDLSVMATHHYMCLTPGDTECSQVAYVYYYTNNNAATLYYIILNDSNVLSVDDAIDAMLKKNTNDSSIKVFIDEWYEKTFKNTIYEAKIDDTIYCGNRNISQLGGWDPNGGSTTQNVYFEDYNPTSNIKCKNIEDSFSVSNNKAKLTYPIALMSASEMNILSYDTGRSIRTSFSSYWYMTPRYSSEATVWMELGGTGGGYDTYGPRNARSVRPAISLIKNTKYSTGDGSTSDPYVVDMSE